MPSQDHILAQKLIYICWLKVNGWEELGRVEAGDCLKYLLDRLTNLQSLDISG